MELDPDAGFAFRMGKPALKPDVLMRGEYSDYMQFIQAMVDGSATVDDEPVSRVGDLSVLESIAEAFAVVRANSTVNAKVPTKTL